MTCAKDNFRCYTFVCPSLELSGVYLSISTLHSANIGAVCYLYIGNFLHLCIFYVRTV